MPDKLWKAHERKAAAKFGTSRNSLSGGNSKVSRSDSIHPKLYLETKSSKRQAIWTLYEDTKSKAIVEGKVPVINLFQTSKQGWLIVVHSNDLQEVYHALLEAMGEEVESMSSVPAPRKKPQARSLSRNGTEQRRVRRRRPRSV